MKREHLYASVDFKFAGEDQPGVFSGYASTFGMIDLGGDMIVKGAFRDTLKEWKKAKKLPPMLLNHGGWEADSDVPIGVFDSMEEDDTGLKFAAHLIALDTDLGKRVHAAMKAGALDGMSIGYRAREFALGTKPDEPRRTLKKLDLVETSVVTFPMNTSARIGMVKSMSDFEAEDWHELDVILRRKDLSRAETARAVSGVKEWLQRDAVRPDVDPCEKGVPDELAEIFRHHVNHLTRT